MPPQKKGTSKALVALLACVGLFIAFVVLIAVIAAIGGTDSTSTGSSGGDAATDEPSGGGEPAAGPGATADNPVPIGTEVEVAKDWTFTVNSVNLDAGPELLAANQFNTPQVDGNTFIAVDATIHNNSDEPGMALTELKIGALPPDGVRVDQSYIVAGVDTLNPTAQLQPGAAVTGKLIFELDPADIPQTTLLVEPQLTLDVNEDQRFFAIQ